MTVKKINYISIKKIIIIVKIDYLYINNTTYIYYKWNR